MSSLLERMILRTRAPLSAVEPLFPPRYAPVDAAPAEPLDNPQREREESAERLSALPALQPRTLEALSPVQRSDAASSRERKPAPVQTRQTETVRGMALSEASAHHPDAKEPGRENRWAAPVRAALEPQPRPAAMQTAEARSRQDKSTALSAAPLTLSRPQAPKPRPDAQAPEVTISIGHIEVRAVQPAERPRRPAFRPRVSLDDFLERGKRR